MWSTQIQNRLSKHVQIKHVQQPRYFCSSARKEQKPVQPKSSSVGAKSFSDDPLPCNVCDFETRSIEELRTHKDSHIQKRTKTKLPFPNPTRMHCPPESNEEANRSIGSTQNCPQGKKTFQHNDALSLHMDFFHGKLNESNPQ